MDGRSAVGALGGFADIGTHALDLLMWLAGDVEAVSADMRSLTNRYPNCDETGQGLLRFASGVTGTISGSWIEPENPVSLLVSGTEGHAVVLNDRLYLRTQKVQGADGARPWMKLAPPAGPPPAAVRQRYRRPEGPAPGDRARGGGPRQGDGGPVPVGPRTEMGDGELSDGLAIISPGNEMISRTGVA